MRVVFIPPDERLWAHYYHQQALQGGAGFIGISPYQRGRGLGNIFGSLFRSLIPMLKSAGRSVGKQALRTGLAVGSDLMAGRDLGASVKEHGRTAASTLLNQAKNYMDSQQQGSGKRKRKRKQKGKGLGVIPYKKPSTVKASIKRGKKRGKKQQYLDIFS